MLLSNSFIFIKSCTCEILQSCLYFASISFYDKTKSKIPLGLFILVGSIFLFSNVRVIKHALCSQVLAIVAIGIGSLCTGIFHVVIKENAESENDEDNADSQTQTTNKDKTRTSMTWKDWMKEHQLYQVIRTSFNVKICELRQVRMILNWYVYPA